MKYFLILLMALTACKNAKEKEVERRKEAYEQAQQEEKERLATEELKRHKEQIQKEKEERRRTEKFKYTICKEFGYITIQSIGGCSSNGDCGILLSTGIHCVARFPVVGQRFKGCTSLVELELTEEEAEKYETYNPDEESRRDLECD